jgi:hypothetical protein
MRDVVRSRFELFSDIPNDQVLHWDETTGAVGVFRSPAGYANGHTVDLQGRLVSCEQGHRRITRTSARDRLEPHLRRAQTQRPVRHGVELGVLLARHLRRAPPTGTGDGSRFGPPGLTRFSRRRQPR